MNSQDAAIPGELLVDPALAPDQRAIVVSAFTALGVRVSVTTMPPRRGAADLQWLIIAVLPLQSFLATVGAKMADDAYSGFRNAISRLFHRKAEGQADGAAEPRPIILQDKRSGIQVVLDHDLPAAGYEQLLGLDLSRFRFGPVHYDRHRQRWRSEVDEAEPVESGD
jgi:hypothetical protein